MKEADCDPRLLTKALRNVAGTEGARVTDRPCQASRTRERSCSFARPRAARAVILLGPERVQRGDDCFGVGPREFVEVAPQELVEAGSPKGGD